MAGFMVAESAPNAAEWYRLSLLFMNKVCKVSSRATQGQRNMVVNKPTMGNKASMAAANIGGEGASWTVGGVEVCIARDE